MLYGLLADLVLLIHLLFVLFVIGGGLFVLQWPRIAWFHIPAVAWGAMIEFMGWICPLTPLEDHLLLQSGRSGYEGDFIGHYLLPILYPGELTRQVQLVLGLLVLVLNVAVYGWILARLRLRRPCRSPATC